MSRVPGKGRLHSAQLEDNPFSRRGLAKLKSDHSALALFQQVVHKDKPHLVSSRTGSAGSSLAEFDIAAQLLQLRNPEQDPMGTFQAFKTNILPHLENYSGPIPAHIWDSSSAVLNVVVTKVKGEVALEVLQIFKTIGYWSMKTRAEIIVQACYEILAHKDEDGDRELKVTTLINMWKHISQERRRSQQSASLKFVFPNLEEVLAEVDSLFKTKRAHKVPAATKCLAPLFPQFVQSQFFIMVPALAASISILSDEQFTSKKTIEAAAPLIDLASMVLSTKMLRTDSHATDDFFMWTQNVPPEHLKVVREYVERRWPKYQAEAAGLGNSIESGNPSALLSHLHKRLRAAYRTRNPNAAVTVWRIVQANLESFPKLEQQLRRSGNEFLEYLVFVLCALRLPDVLQEALGLMNRLQVSPTIKTYTAMMHGWKLCKDMDRIDALWQKLVASNAPLDSFIWAERISGLIEFGRPQQAIDTLASMMSTWKGSKSTDSPAAKPTIEVINATIKGLVSHDPDAAKGVLAWAAGEGIEPNVRTYNILLSEAFKNDTSPEGVTRILAAMSESSVEPDAATFTIILESVLSGIQHSSPEEQVSAVEQVFREIGASGLAANGETYGKMLYAVGSLSKGSDAAVKAVLNHMRSRGMAVTPHMVTMLLERTLAEDPQNPRAVEKLLQDHGMTSVEKGDQALWERVISTLALMGDLEGAMRRWDELRRSGRTAESLACLKDLLNGLLERSDVREGTEDGQPYRDMAAKVVNAVLEHNKGKEVSERYWKHHFWYLAREHGLVRQLPPSAK